MPAASASEPRALDTRRIVSIGGAVTQILYALGVADRIVAVDDTSRTPPEALRDKPSVGYMRQLSPEGVLSVDPTAVIAAADAGPVETVRVLEAAAVPLLRVPDRFDGEGILAKVRLIAEAVGARERGDCLAGAVSADLATLNELRSRLIAPRRAVFVLSFVKGRAMVGGHNTAADGLMRLAGLTNAFAGMEGFKPVNDEAIVGAAPDVVIVLQRSGPGTLTAGEVFAHPAFAATPAAARGAFIAVEGPALSFGPSTTGAARELALALQPELAASSVSSVSSHAEAPCRP